MGAALAVKRGQTKGASAKARKLAESMSEKQLREYAKK